MPEPEISRVGRESLHAQITQRLLELARRRSPGEPLPPESQLMSRYGVSRTTVRRAVDTLVERGVCVRRQGRGTFIREVPHEHALDQLSPFVAMLMAAGQEPETDIVSFGWVVGAEVPSALGEATRAIEFRRRYVNDGRPHALTHVRIAERFATTITRSDVEASFVLPLLERRHGMVLRRATYVTRAEGANPEVAELLGLPVGAPLLVLERVTQTSDGVPVEATSHYLHPDVHTLKVSVADEPALRLDAALSAGEASTARS